MRQHMWSLAGAGLAVILALASAESEGEVSDIIEPGEQAASAEPGPEPRAASAAELDLLAASEAVPVGFTFDHDTKGKDAPPSAVREAMGQEPGQPGVPSVAVLGHYAGPDGPIWLTRSEHPYGGLVATWHQVRATEDGLKSTMIGTTNIVACGDAHTYRMTVEADGRLAVLEEQWTEVCGDEGGEPVKTESMSVVHPDGRIEPVAG